MEKDYMDNVVLSGEVFCGSNWVGNTQVDIIAKACGCNENGATIYGLYEKIGDGCSLYSSPYPTLEAATRAGWELVARRDYD